MTTNTDRWCECGDPSGYCDHEGEDRGRSSDYKVTTSWLDDQPQDEVDSSMERFRQSRNYRRYITDYRDERFAFFMALVDRRLSAMTGLTAMDMADFNSWDCYEAGMSPKEAAQECLEQQDGYEFFFGGE